MKPILIFICIFGLLILITCCKNKSVNEPNEPSDQVLLFSSFEKNGLPHNNGWYILNKSQENYSMDVPPGGGKYSLTLRGDHRVFIGESAKISMAPFVGTNIYKPKLRIYHRK